MFASMNTYRVILVVGTAEAGVIPVTQALARDLGYEAITDPSHQLAQWARTVRTASQAVIASHHFMRFVDQYAGRDDVAVVCVHRDHNAIRRLRRNGDETRYTQQEAASMMRYADLRDRPAIDSLAVRYRHWSGVQKKALRPHAYEVRYEDMIAHDDFEPMPAPDPPPTPPLPGPARMLIVTLGYRLVGQALQSWLAALQHFETVGSGRYDWLFLNGVAPGDYENKEHIVAKYREARRHFLAGDYDIFIAIEDDMVIPADTFPRLLAMLDDGADIGYGLYAWRHGIGGGSWSAYPLLTSTYGESVVYDTDRAVKWFKAGKPQPVQGVGLGCTAVQRRVLEQIDFTLRDGAANDWYFAADAAAAGFDQRCDFGLICGHISMRPSPRIIWPAIDDVDEGDQRRMQRIEYL